MSPQTGKRTSGRSDGDPDAKNRGFGGTPVDNRSMGYIDRPPSDDRRRAQRRKGDRRDRQRRQRIEGVEEERRSGEDRRGGPDRRSGEDRRRPEDGPGDLED